MYWKNPQMKTKNIQGMKVNASRCSTCPFNDDGCISVRNTVMQRCLTQASQLCHGTDNKTLCRGARDWQIEMFHRLGFLKEPTEECWNKTFEEMKRCPLPTSSRKAKKQS